jgi:hypothetical protein
MHPIEMDLNNAARIDMKVSNVCSPHPIGTIASDAGMDTRKRLRLTRSQITDRCLYVTIDAVYVPPGQTRPVYTCDYYQSGPVENH